VRAWNARLGGQRVVARELERAVDPAASRCDLVPGALEDPQLGVAVTLERAVAVEVVRLEVQQYGHLELELVNVLELEGGQLGDDPRVHRRIERSDRRARRGRRGDVAGHLDIAAARAQHRAEELRCGGLALGAGDPDEPAGAQQPIAELDFAPNRDPARPRRAHKRRLRRNTWTLHHELDTVEHVVRYVAEPDLDTGRAEVTRVELLVAVDGDDVDASCRKRAGRRLARPRKPEHERPLRQVRRRFAHALPQRPPRGPARPLGTR